MRFNALTVGQADLQKAYMHTHPHTHICSDTIHKRAYHFSTTFTLWKGHTSRAQPRARQSISLSPDSLKVGQGRLCRQGEAGGAAAFTSARDMGASPSVREVLSITACLV